MAETIKPLLDLTTGIERKHITVDGKVYPIRNLGEFSLMDQHRMIHDARAMNGIDAGGDEGVSDEEYQKAVDGMNRTFELVVIGSDELKGILLDSQKLEVIHAFFDQAGALTRGLKAMRGKGKVSRSRRVSKDSTAEARKTG